MSRSSRRRSRLLIDDEWDGEDTRFSAGLRDCMNVIYGILIAIFVVTSVALIFIYIRRVRRADSNLRENIKPAETQHVLEPRGETSEDIPPLPINKDKEDIIPPKNDKKDEETPTPSLDGKGNDEPQDDDNSRIRAIAKKLKELKLTVNEDSSLDDPKAPSQRYRSVMDISDVKSIKTSEIAAIVKYFRDLEPKFKPNEEADAIKKFKTFTGKYNKKFKHLDHFIERYRNFRVNYKEIEAHNKDPKNTYKKGYNHFADYSEREFSDGMARGYGYKPYPNLSVSSDKLDDIEGHFVGIDERSDIEFDWRSEDVISSVMDQGDCGSCWAFSVAGAIDAAYNIKHKRRGKDKIQVSPQQFVDCSKDGKDGCDGAPLVNPFKYSKDKGACLASDVPYLAVSRECKESRCKKRVKISSYSTVSKDNAFKTLKTRGPVCIGMATNKDFLLYESGVFNGTCDKTLNHAMLLVGYGIDKKTSHKYWIVKNSWGTDWGEEGYIKVSRDTKQKDNLCQIMNDVHAVVI